MNTQTWIYTTAALSLSWLALSCGQDAQEGAEPGEELCTLQQAAPIGVGNPPSDPVEVLSSAQLKEMLEGPCADRRCWLKLVNAVYEGNFIVPAGSIIEGVVVDNTPPRVSGAQEDVPVFQIKETDACTHTVLRNLSIDNDGTGVSARAAGFLYLEGSQITVRRSVAVAMQGMRGVRLAHTNLGTELTLEELRGVPLDVYLAGSPAVGLLADNNESLHLEDVGVASFSAYGVALRNSPMVWNQGVIQNNQGYGMFITGARSDVQLTGVTIQETLRSDQWMQRIPVGLVLRGGATLRSQDLKVLQNEGAGILQDNATALHEGLESTANDLAGYWVQNSHGPQGAPALTLRGSSLEGNTLAGLVGQRSTGLLLEDTQILNTAAYEILVELEAYSLADGIQLSGMGGDISLRDVSLSDNARAGLLVDGAGVVPTGATFLFEGVDITSQDPSDASFGAIVQNFEGEVPLDALTIDEALRLNDANLSAPLQVTPVADPPADDPNQPWISEGGLLDLNGAARPDTTLGASGLGQ